MPTLVPEYIEETCCVEYPISSCRRLLKEAGLRHQNPRRLAAKYGENKQEEFREELKKRREMATM